MSTTETLKLKLYLPLLEILVTFVLEVGSYVCHLFTSGNKYLLLLCFDAVRVKFF